MRMKNWHLMPLFFLLCAVIAMAPQQEEPVIQTDHIDELAKSNQPPRISAEEVVIIIAVMFIITFLIVLHTMVFCGLLLSSRPCTPVRHILLSSRFKSSKGSTLAIVPPAAGLFVSCPNAFLPTPTVDMELWGEDPESPVEAEATEDEDLEKGAECSQYHYDTEKSAIATIRRSHHRFQYLR
ncbi:hypothetical protein J8273_2819 [Carpediemonas membranifera]|uniref:Uncharacterized protein n=1 Tax=Carpediemonas membranifera TaxID=201153 RepID=A0A8J6B8X0_9EUKA|nr:hypothetical protein J8273_2819 [Carpediemonas membranifera]|eukprot:KAG9395624.1 hypothetical protein J8273_2819 [Carpediemonas membranifera]